jgi:hypothetical protein
MVGGRTLPAIVGTEPRHFARFNLDPQRIAAWEDGMRTDGRPGTYEWWYFDAHLDDGTQLVITFYTKPFTDVGKPLTPYITVNLGYPDGRSDQREHVAPPAAFHAATDRCDVRIGPSRFAGDLRRYTIHVEFPGVLAEVTLTGEVPPWRPGTGHLLAGAREEHTFAWLPAVPQGRAEVTVRIDGEERRAVGIGYHDHNWGNIAIPALVNHWYWARGQLGDYTVIVAHIVAERRYGYASLPIFMLAKGGVIVADDGAKARFRAAAIRTDDFTGKPVANTIAYDYRDGERRYVLTFTRDKEILRLRFIEMVHGLKRLLARLVRYDGAYLRCTGDLRLECYAGEDLVETMHDEALWELMYFGRTRPEDARG